MNNEELLAQFLDGSLTEAQQTDFQRLLQTSPAFALEAREIMTIQDLLQAPSEDDERTSAFLRKVEDNLANALIAAGAAATAGTVAVAVGKSAASASAVTSSAISSGVLATGAAAKVGTGVAASTGAASAGMVSWISSFVSTIFASTSSMVVSAGIGIATIAGGAATVNYVVKKNAERQAIEATSSAASQTLQERTGTVSQGSTALEDASKLSNPALNNNTATDNTEQQSSQAASTVSSTSQAKETSRSATGTQSGGVPAKASTVSASETKPREYSARISGGAAQSKYAVAINDYTKQLQAKEASQDRMGAAFVEKSLGVLLRQSAQFSESRLHLGNAAKAAHTLGLQELEGEALAELALLDAAEGKKGRALQGMETAITMLQSAKSKSLQRWQKELEKLSGK